MFHDRTPRRELQNVEEQLAAPQAPVPVMGTADTVPNGGSMEVKLVWVKLRKTDKKCLLILVERKNDSLQKKEKESGLVILLKGKTLIKKKDMFVFFSDF